MAHLAPLIQMARARLSLLTVLVGMLAGCDSARPPVFLFYQTYYSAWPICTAIGIGAAILGRLLFIVIGVDDGLPFRVPVYGCIGVLAALASAMLLYGR